MGRGRVGAGVMGCSWGFAGFQGELGAVVGDLDRVAVGQLVAGSLLGHLYAHAFCVEEDGEREAGQALRQAGGERHPAIPVTQAREPADEREPGARKRGDVHAVAGVLFQVLQVHQRGLAQVVEGEGEVTGLGRDDRLGAGRQRGVAHGERFVVGEIPPLLLRGEVGVAQLHREHQVGLFDDLLAVQVEVGVVEQQRIVVGRSAREVPDLVPGESLGLRVHAQRLVIRDVHGLPGVPPAGRLLGVDAQFAGPVRVALRGRRGGQQVPARHHVGVDVVVGDGAVLVRAGDTVDVEPASGVVMAQRSPQPRGVGQQVQSGAPGELHIAGGVDVPDHRVGDVGVDVERGRAGRPVPRALLAVDGPPREGRARQAQLSRMVQGGGQHVVPPPQRAGGRVRRGEREHRQDECLGVPEGVPVVTRPGQALRRDGTVLPRAPACSTWNSANRTACWISASPSSSRLAQSQKPSRKVR